MAVDPSVTFVSDPRPANGGPSDGAAGGLQIRLAPHSYAGGGETLAGADRPNPRDVSNQVFNQLDGGGDLINMPNSGGFSSLLWVWGQFLDHDLDQTSNGPDFGRAPITVAAGDPAFAPGSTLPFTRSAFLTGTGTSEANPRQFANEITSFIDASNVYGSSATRLSALLEPGTAKLKLTASGTIGFGSNDPVFNNGVITGDTRANENVALLSMHALFAREHNRIVDELSAAAPGLSTAALFEGARARVEAIMQAITYREFLPILIGDGAIDAYAGFRSNVNPAISLEFSTAIYRMGHTLLSPTIARMNEDGTTHATGNLALRNAFNTRGVVEQSGIEAILRGMSTTMSQEFDTFMVEDVRSLLFGGGGPGTDLAALNIQRGRDHGLPSYNEMRVALGLDPKTSFSQITSDAATAARLSAAYGGDISKLDLWVGGLAEDSVAGGMMGETFRLVMIDQFTRLRDGDRFWSEGRGFSAAELAELWGTTLSDVIRRNSGVVDLQDFALLAFERRAGDAGADTITGGSGRNLIIGAGGDDRLIGGASADHLVGGTGDDRLEGRGGDNVLIGGAGADTFVIDVDRSNRTTVRDWTPGDLIEFANTAGVPAMVVEDGPDGAIVRFGGAVALFEGVRAADLPLGGGGGGGPTPGVTLTGTSGANTLTGGAGNDTISGLGGGDTLSGLGGDDALFGGGGNDQVNGGDGDDTLTGGSGVDIVDGGDGDDVILIRRNAAQTDTMTGGAGVETLRLDDTTADVILFGTQRISGIEIFDAGGRAVLGSSGADVLDFSIFTTLTGVASIQGLDGTDTITGGRGADTLFGGNGDDRLDGGGGTDSLTSGAGADTFVIDVGRGDQVTIRDWTSVDAFVFVNQGGAPALTVEDGPTGAIIRFGGAVARVEGVDAADLPFGGGGGGPTPGVTLTGTSGANTLTGGAGNDTISGLGGNDTLNGLGGNDTLTGGSGVDAVNGGDGDDVILIRAAAAVDDTMNGGAGNDTIRLDDTRADIVLTRTTRITGVENYEGGGRSVLGTAAANTLDFSIFTSVTGLASIQGLDGNDTITGSGAADPILGGSGVDTISGGRGGNDTLTGGLGNDVFQFAANIGTGRDTITDFDASGNDLIRLAGFSFGSANPGSLSTQARLNAVSAATTFDGGGATIALDPLGGSGEIRLNGVTTLAFSGTEDFLFA